MEKKKLIFICLGIFISFIISVFAIVFQFIGKNEIPAVDIYKRSLTSVVEVKASSENVGESFGTGEILTTDGKIITNAHVVTYARLGVVNEFDNYYIRFAFEDNYREVELEKYDTNNDLALLKIIDFQDIHIVPIKTGDSENLESGDNVYAVGNASNYGIGIYKGIISIPLVNIELDGHLRSVIQCDLTIAAGNSGGALLNDSGELIGITTFRTKDNSGNVIYGIVYCIPINIVLEFTNE